MTCSDPARASARGTRSIVLAALVVALVGVLVHQAAAPSSSSEPPTRATAPPIVPHGATIFDDELPAVANLDRDLLGALRRAATDAAADGVELSVTSGGRAREHQDRLRREAVHADGAAEAAARWGAAADTSAHVSGDAVDVGPSAAAAWLSEHGAEHGLCRIYDNEPWHYELRPEAVGGSCPPMYADPTHDPRMQP